MRMPTICRYFVPQRLPAAGFLASILLAATAGAQSAPPGGASATNAAAAPAPTSAAADDFFQQLKQPAPWLSDGGDFRARDEYFNNLLTLNPGNHLHEQDYLRFRARIWASLSPVTNLSLNIRLATEPREWFRQAGYTTFKNRSGGDWTEGVVDTLNVQWRNILGQPATLTVGRQDLTLGDGWLVMEGTPNDGSWTAYLDSARFTYELPNQDTTLDVIGIAQDAKDDGWLPTINNQNRIETDQNEKGAIFDIGNKTLPAANLDAYFIYKRDDRLGGNLDTYGDNADIFTVGGRVSGLVADHWKYSGEGAYQFGHKQDTNIYPSHSTDYRPISAYGFNTKLAYLFKDTANDQLNFSFEFLSGDDPNSHSDEMFDVLWGRWPRWSEIGLYSYAAETRVGQEANLIRFGPSWNSTPFKGTDLTLATYSLFSPQAVPTREASATLFSNNGHYRGQFVQGILKHKFSPHVSGHLWTECLFPGDYYAHHAAIPFLRLEMMFSL
jgi:hypothetical protein